MAKLKVVQGGEPTNFGGENFFDPIPEDEDATMVLKKRTPKTILVALELDDRLTTYLLYIVAQYMKVKRISPGTLPFPLPFITMRKGNTLTGIVWREDGKVYHRSVRPVKIVK